ncbi:DeoR/GlpR family DNA-binding transcription regulator [Niameybacter massiliensis]|uniref:DeoR/GlpR family DNA-binding transcription regulator n=1 Tax=Holtiella tumoricola TaxID=3018743 RepID=A0AA42DKR8_9FIRM|nr:DeoR/GlpR family DNA-binding transcription regulator [Holtiella tumoricola]MDA3730830.1 DeoR/GlpR family DNA-binding transcription regulator [Holtiella tumoricola]
MLIEERQQLILQILKQKGTVSVAELVELYNASESTIRRDLATLDEKGYLQKIHGGAMLKSGIATHVEYKMSTKQAMHIEDKRQIAKKAASIIQDGDVIYLDAGTTIEALIDYIEANDLVVVTNGIGHVQKLLQKGIQTIILGGSVKMNTEAVVGAGAVAELEKYQFTKGFFGANGVSAEQGFTTPDIEEAMVKQKALNKCNEAYVLADNSKVDEVSFVRFASLEQANFITNGKLPSQFYEQTTIIEVDNKHEQTND